MAAEISVEIKDWERDPQLRAQVMDLLKRGVIEAVRFTTEGR